MGGNLQDRQIEMKARMLGAKKPRKPKPAKCWNDYGVVNADAQSLYQSSIPRWGEKIKLRTKSL